MLSDEGVDQQSHASGGASAPPRLRLFRLSRPEEAILAMPLLRAYHTESPFGRFPFSERKALQKVLDILNRGESGACIYATLGHRVLGGIDLAVGQPYLSEQGTLATCMGWFVMPEVRKTLLGGRVAAILLREAKSWSSEKRASALLIHGTHGFGMGLARSGHLMGRNMLMEISP